MHACVKLQCDDVYIRVRMLIFSLCVCVWNGAGKVKLICLLDTSRRHDSLFSEARAQEDVSNFLHQNNNKLTTKSIFFLQELIVLYEQASSRTL